LLADLAGTEWIGLDTEFIRESTYHPKLCLVQIAAPGILACLDPLALRLDALAELLSEPGRLTVLHAGSQDLEILQHEFGHLPARLFDTQIAATVLGLGDSIGYANLVSRVLGEEVDKSQTRTDWSARPLTEAQLAYALDDVRHLEPLWRQLSAELERLGRAGWIEDDLAALKHAAAHPLPAEDAWLKLKGTHTLKPAELAAVQALAEWREETARRENRPRRWLLADETLIDLGRFRPRSLAQIERIRGLNPNQIRFNAEAWLAVLRAAEGQTPRPHPEPPRPVLDAQQEALLSLLEAAAQAACVEAGVSLGVVTSRRELTDWLLGQRQGPLAQGWRWQLVGERVAAVLEGRLSLGIRDGALAWHTQPDQTPA